MRGEVALAQKGYDTFAKADWGSPLFEGSEPSSGQLYMIGSMYVKSGLLADAINTFKHCIGCPIHDAHATLPEFRLNFVM